MSCEVVSGEVVQIPRYEHNSDGDDH
jgi:hypothetical protein